MQITDKQIIDLAVTRSNHKKTSPTGIVYEVFSHRRLLEFARALEAALATTPAQVPDGWQPIETAPKDGTPVLCFRPDDQFSPITGMDVLWFEPSIKRWLYNGEPVWNPPTHWMPLPASPAKGGGENV